MKRILLVVSLFFVFSFALGEFAQKDINVSKGNIINKNVSIKGGKGTGFSIDNSKPIEIGITAFENDGVDFSFSVYMINHQPVSGIQLDMNSDDNFLISDVSGGRAEDSNFALHYNKNGRVLGFSMSGGFISESSSQDKSKNILFNVKATSKSKLSSPITIKPIFADRDAKKMEYKSIPFQIGK